MQLYANEPVETRVLRLLYEYEVATIQSICKILGTNHNATNGKLKDMTERGLLEITETQKSMKQPYKYSLSETGRKRVQSYKEDYKTNFLALDVFDDMTEKNLYKQSRKLIRENNLSDAGYDFLNDINFELAVMDKPNRTIHLLVEDIHSTVDKINDGRFETQYNKRYEFQTSSGEVFKINVVVYYVSPVKYEISNETDCGIKLINIFSQPTEVKEKKISEKRKHNFDKYNASRRSQQTANT